MNPLLLLLLTLLLLPPGCIRTLHAADQPQDALRSELLSLPARYTEAHRKLLPKLEGSTADMVQAHRELIALLKPAAIRVLALSEATSPEAASTLIDRDLQALSRNLHHQMNYAGPGGSFEAIAIASVHLAYLQYALAYHTRKLFGDNPDFKIDDWTSSWSAACGFEEGC